MRAAVSALLLLLGVSPALASEGVLEINQTCAVRTGCFSGDAAGLPVTIDGSAGRSYRLTSDLVVPNENTDGIQVSSDHISIDLGGFEIRGPVVCSGAPLTCVPSTGTGTGVERTSTTLAGISVRNGSVRGMGSLGVLLALASEVTSLRVRSNGSDGIFVGSGSLVTGNTTQDNGGRGIYANSGSTVSGNTAYGNANAGIQVNSGSTVSGNTSYRNGGDGIETGNGANVTGNTSYDNDADGIQTASGCFVKDNAVRVNGGYGLRLGSQTGYRENVIAVNSAGTVDGGVDAGGNVCNGSLTCP